jgi:hypothetical protein
MWWLPPLLGSETGPLSYASTTNNRNKEGAYTEDARVGCFKKEWFAGKRVLDIGCNIGVVTNDIGTGSQTAHPPPPRHHVAHLYNFAAAKKFRPQHILGIDVDPELAQRAQQTVERDQRWKAKHKAKLAATRAKRITFDDDGKPEERKSTQEALEEEKEKGKGKGKEEEEENIGTVDEVKDVYPYNIAYRTENFVEDKEQHDQKYDVILW